VDDEDKHGKGDAHDAQGEQGVDVFRKPAGIFAFAGAQFCFMRSVRLVGTGRGFARFTGDIGVFFAAVAASMREDAWLSG
jgi:hypothetical protein